MLATTTALSLHALSAAPHHLKIQKQRRETPSQCSTNRSKTTSTTQAPLWRPYTPRPPPPTAARSARSCGLLSQLQAVFLRMPATRTPSNSPPYLIQFACSCGNTTAAPSARAQASEQGQRARAQKAPVTKGGLGYGSAFPLKLLVLTRLVVRVLFPPTDSPNGSMHTANQRHPNIHRKLAVKFYIHFDHHLHKRLWGVGCRV